MFRRALIPALLALPLLGSVAAAHPHVWISSSGEVIFDDRGEVSAVRVAWRFDELYSAFAIQGADTDKDGTTSAAELKALAEQNVTFLKEWDYFTYLKIDGIKAEIGPVTEYDNTVDDGVLTLSFVMPLAYPADPRKHRVAFASYDPSYFIAFEVDRDREPQAHGAVPEGCRVTAYGPDEAPQQVADQLIQALVQSGDWAAQYAPVVRVECGD
ncbi:MAG: DUF1007 family protein [Pseudomonadota bacterium]|nr:DUF1007 family protein [Pseudomonadota bacterium]